MKYNNKHTSRQKTRNMTNLGVQRDLQGPLGILVEDVATGRSRSMDNVVIDAIKVFSFTRGRGLLLALVQGLKG